MAPLLLALVGRMAQVLALQAEWPRCLGLAVEQVWVTHRGFGAAITYIGQPVMLLRPCWGPALGLYWAFPFLVVWPEGVGFFVWSLVQDCWSSLQLLKHPVWDMWETLRTPVSTALTFCSP